MKILIPTADYPPIEGGIASVALHVPRTLAQLGHEVTVIAPYFPNMAAFDRAEPVTVIRYRGYHAGWLRFLPMWAATWPHVKGSDLILGINVAYGGLLGRLAARAYRKPYVAFAYAYEFLRFRKHPMFAALLRSVYQHARVVVAISHFTRDNLVAFGAPAARIAVIFPGASAAQPLDDAALAQLRYRYVLDDGPIILCVGRFVRRKGHVTLIRSLPRILERFPNAQLVLVGRGPEMWAASNETHTLGVRNHVVFPGCVSEADLAGLYQACTLFALPAGEDEHGQVEGFGLVFAEAHAYGKPVVAGRSGGVVDAVIDGETGLLVEPDDPEALATAIVSILEDTELAQRLGENGKRRVEAELNWTRFTQRLLESVEARR